MPFCDYLLQNEAACAAEGTAAPVRKHLRFLRAGNGAPETE
jgi:hypothetical protein